MADTTDLGSMASMLRELAATPLELLVRGTVVDEQFEIERMIGHGAMGVVYLARDKRLHRNVALKIARGQSPVMLARTSREAVLLARLSHPNVVIIHQIGSLDGRVYVAMEHVDGTTARAWCAGKSVRTIIDLYIAVGEGLAAAHAAGLVHRDFKPDNVLVGDDGRARVADFGLARELTDGDAGRAGTPAYMPPEQLRGDDTDARADQYAYCVALAEALGTQRIPRHVERALERGRAADRDARWPAMAPLLHELRRAPVKPARIALVGVAAIAVPAVLFALHSTPEAAIDPCAGGATRIATRWSSGHAAKVRAALVPAGAAPWLARGAATTEATLDAWSARWVDSYRAACTAAWTPALHDRGEYCLGRAEHDLAATVDRLEEPGLDPTNLDAVVGRLPRPESCADPVYLAEAVPPPTDPQLARAVSERQAQLDHINVFLAAGQHDGASAFLANVEALPPLDYAPLAARIQELRAIVDFQGDDKPKAATELADAYFASRAAGDRAIAAASANNLALLLLDMSRDADATHWAHLAEVEVATIADPLLEGRTLTSLAAVAVDRSDPQHALELAQRAVTLLRSAPMEGPLSDALTARGDAYAGTGKYDAALADYDEIMRITTASFGELHPRNSSIEDRRAVVFDALGKHGEAIAAARRALAIAEATTALDSTTVSAAVGQLGIALSHAQQFTEALAMQDRLIAADRKADGDESYNVASDLNNRCDLLTQMNRYDEAIAACRGAIATWTKELAPDSTELGICHYNIALALLDGGHDADAVAEAGLVLAATEKHPERPAAWLARVVRGRAEARLHRLAAARADLEPVIAHFREGGSDPEYLAWAQLELARVAQAGGTLDEARTLVVAARDGFRAHQSARLPQAEALVTELGVAP